MFVDIGRSGDVSQTHWPAKALRSTRVTYIGGAFAYSAGLRVHHNHNAQHTCPCVAFHLFFLMKKKKKGKENLWLSLGVMWPLPIGLARCRGVLPQGQRRHNVSLSGCRTGQRRHVSHTVPSQLWAAALPSFPLSAVSGRNGRGAWNFAAYAERRRTRASTTRAKFTDAEKKKERKKTFSCPLNFQDGF